MIRIISLLVLFVFILSSCEDSMVLRSEKKLKSELQGIWEREFLGDTSIHYREQWCFEGDKLHTRLISLDPPDFLDNGTKDSILTDNNDTVVKTGFKIDARVTRAYLKFQLIDRGIDSTVFVDKWEFVTLEKDVLYLATDDPVSNSVLQIEFFKVE